MSDADKATWAENARASKYNLPGYHYFLREAQRDLYTHHGLCGYWHCNEIIGGRVLDLSGNGNHGTLEPDYPSNAPSLVSSKSDRFSRALSYDGVDEYVDCGRAASLAITGAVMLESWVYLTGNLITRYNIINKGWDYYETAITDGVMKTYYQNQGPVPKSLTGGNISLNTWHALNSVIDSTSNSVKNYIDGKETASAEFDGTSIYNSINYYLALGIRQPDKDAPHKGIIDEACVYNRGFSAAEIATRYRFAIAKV